jgi:hypothetical protein
MATKKVAKKAAKKVSKSPERVLLERIADHMHELGDEFMDGLCNTGRSIVREIISATGKDASKVLGDETYEIGLCSISLDLPRSLDAEDLEVSVCVKDLRTGKTYNTTTSVDDIY